MVLIPNTSLNILLPEGVHCAQERHCRSAQGEHEGEASSAQPPHVKLNQLKQVDLQIG